MNQAPSPRIDHVVINVGQRLDEAQAQFMRLGFALTPRGHHSRGTSNHLAIFDSDYLELIGVEPARAGAAVDWGHPPGLVGLVFKTTDAHRLATQLAARGVPLDAASASDLSRPVELADGSVRDARFLTLRLAPDAVPNGRVFFCDHRTPELVWQAAWQTHPNGVTAVAEYVYVAHDPQQASALLAKVHGAEHIVDVPGGRRLITDTAAVSWLVADEIQRRYGEQALAPQRELVSLSGKGASAGDAANGEGANGGGSGRDRAIALELQCTSLATSAAALEAGRVPYKTLADGSLMVAPADAFGTTLVFRASPRPAPRA